MRIFSVILSLLKCSLIVLSREGAGGHSLIIASFCAEIRLSSSKTICTNQILAASEMFGSGTQMTAFGCFCFPLNRFNIRFFQC